MMNAKKYAIIALTSFTLSACSVGPSGISLGVGLGGSIGNNIGIGTSVNIPISTRSNTSSNNRGGINVIEKDVVTYFDIDARGNKESRSPIIGGYMRELIEKKKDGQWLVQDYFEDQSAYARTDPFIVSKKRAYQFNAHPTFGSMRIYHRNGNIAEERNYVDDKLVYAKIYNQNGKLIREERK